jgi:hypothetical protein
LRCNPIADDVPATDGNDASFEVVEPPLDLPLSNANELLAVLFTQSAVPELEPRELHVVERDENEYLLVLRLTPH